MADRDAGASVTGRLQAAARRASSSDASLVALTVGPTALLLTFVIVLPIAWMVYASLHRVPALSPEWTFVGLAQYAAIFGDPAFYESLAVGVVFATSSVAVQTTFGVALALLLNREFTFSRLARVVAFVPYMIPTVVLAFVALWMGNQQWGVVNQLLLDAGLVSSPVAWFSTSGVAMPALVLTGSWKFSIFVTISVLARLQSIPEEFYEAAAMAGATRLQRFRDVTLPEIRNVLAVVVLLRFVWMFNKFDLVWVLTHGGPSGATTTPPVYAYRQAFVFMNLGRAAAVSCLLFVMLAGFAVVYLYVLRPSEEVR